MLPHDAGTQLLHAIAPRFRGEPGRRQAEIIAAIGPALIPTCAQYSIASALRLAHFLAQCGHESAGYRTTEEFASGAAYEGREDLGNTKPGDGRRYKGRGILQLTGRANYKTYGTLLGLDLEGSPEVAAEPVISLRIACEYWRQRAINPMADRDDLIAVTRAVNGGRNGIDDRRKYLGWAKDAIADILADQAPRDATRPTLRRGSSGEAVEVLQAILAGFEPDARPLAVDGDFGPATERAVRAFQDRQDLLADGIVGALTWAALDAVAG